MKTKDFRAQAPDWLTVRKSQGRWGIYAGWHMIYKEMDGHVPLGWTYTNKTVAVRIAKAIGSVSSPHVPYSVGAERLGGK